MKTEKERLPDIRVPKSKAERVAEYAGLSAEERAERSEAAQARVHKQLSESRKRATKIVAERDARRARGGRPEEEEGDGGNV